MMSDSESNLTIYFDGVCNLCNGFVDWILSKKKSTLFRYASLQGDTAKRSLSETDRTQLSSVVVITASGKVLKESAAVLYIFRFLHFPYPLFSYSLGIFPEFFLNIFYHFIAKNRYRFFGKRETCRLPTEAEKKFFLP